MPKLNKLTPEFVEFIPDDLESGILYISKRYRTALHLCCCGCGNEVVTPINPAKWRLLDEAGVVSLTPSIGNWSLPCKSHYWIVENRIQWAGVMTSVDIATVKERDRIDVLAQVPEHAGLLRRLRRAMHNTVVKILIWLRH